MYNGTRCRNAVMRGANVRFEYKSVFGWEVAYMPPSTEVKEEENIARKPRNPTLLALDTPLPKPKPRNADPGGWKAEYVRETQRDLDAIRGE